VSCADGAGDGLGWIKRFEAERGMTRTLGTLRLLKIDFSRSVQFQSFPFSFCHNAKDERKTDETAGIRAYEPSLPLICRRAGPKQSTSAVTSSHGFSHFSHTICNRHRHYLKIDRQSDKTSMHRQSDKTSNASAVRQNASRQSLMPIVDPLGRATFPIRPKTSVRESSPLSRHPSHTDVMLSYRGLLIRLLGNSPGRSPGCVAQGGSLWGRRCSQFPIPISANKKMRTTRATRPGCDCLSVLHELASEVCLRPPTLHCHRLVSMGTSHPYGFSLHVSYRPYSLHQLQPPETRPTWPCMTSACYSPSTIGFRFCTLICSHRTL
jgi:hypothetical protein